MKILLVINKYLKRESYNRLDGGYWNIYIPLLQLGYEVKFYDILNGENDTFQKIVENYKPDLIFSCLTFNKNFAKYEPLEEISEITKKGNIKTFNWFCDDTWRFDTISKKYCWNFFACSTPEPEYIKKYKEIGYNNILLGCWHTNKDFTHPNITKKYNVSFCGVLNNQRISMLSSLKNENIDVNNFYGCTNEEMMLNYSLSKIGINFSKNENDPLKKTQMKARMIEIPASNSLLLTEYTPGLENLFIINKEIITFIEEKEMIEKLKYLLKNESLINKISNAGYQRFLKDHESKIRLKKIIEEINII